MRVSVRDFDNFLFASGVILCFVTHVRVGSEVPLGLGETLLALWLACRGLAVFRSFRKIRIPRKGVIMGFLVFWLLAGTLAALGMLVALGLGQTPPTRTLCHDALALTFTGAVMIALTLRDTVGSDEKDELLTLLYGLTAVLTAGILLASVIPSNVILACLWYGTVRLCGLSENPNQFALLLTPIPFMGWHLWTRYHSARHRWLIFLAGFVCVTAGLLTRSDALVVAWGATTVSILSPFFLRAISHVILGRATIWGWVFRVMGGSMLMAWIPFAVSLFVKRFFAMCTEGHQASVRFALYENGVIALVRSFFLGLGPGAHSGLAGPFQGSEVHCSPLDWALMTGLAGLFLYLGLWGYLFWKSLRMRKWPILGLLASLFAFSLFHQTLRHPWFWVLIFICVITLRRRGTHTCSVVA